MVESLQGLGFAQLLVLLVALQRIVELGFARRNERRLRAEGAFEVGAGHYPVMVLLHASWLVALFLLIPAETLPSWPLLLLYGVVQFGRYWTLLHLGRFWTTRVIILPDAELVSRGPYRWVRHPNYWIVAMEIALLPLVFGAWALALAFSVANALVLAWRIRVESRALSQGLRVSQSQ